MKPQNVLIAIPAFNEEKTIQSVIRSLKKLKINKVRLRIVVINDGSTDKTAIYARKMKIRVITHMLNRGLGGALGTAFSYAKRYAYDIMVTFDADGQHRTSDIVYLLRPIMQGYADVVIGSRLLYQDGMPFVRRVINICSNILTFLLFGVWTSDSQSGMRAFSKKSLQKIILHTQRMEVSSEVFREIKRNKLRFCEIPIQPIYTQYSLQKGQRITNAYYVLSKLLLHKLKVLVEF